MRPFLTGKSAFCARDLPSRLTSSGGAGTAFARGVRLAPGRDIPDWYRDEQHRLFRHVEEPLRVLQPRAAPKRRVLLARSLFSAVHGLVRLGLEEKLQTIPLTVLREQMTYIVTAIGRGMTVAD
jgi:Tetracyclin repressor-like, C-terminal domain